jgi:hypothetical protein
MKFLFYTISDLHPSSLNCTDILYKSLKNKIKNLNFQIISPNIRADSNTENKMIKYVKSDYLSICRYSREIFEQDYDYFIYFDSDIYFNLEENIFLNYINGYDIVIYKESELIKNNIWFNIKMDDFFLEKYQNRFGINSGFFCFSKKAGLNCSEYISSLFTNIYNLSDSKKKNNSYRRSITMGGFHIKNKMTEFMSEQSLFNKFLIENENFYNINDISDRFVSTKYWLNGKYLSSEVITENKIYHFNGYFSKNMSKKVSWMNDFLRNNNL